MDGAGANPPKGDLYSFLPSGWEVGGQPSPPQQHFDHAQPQPVMTEEYLHSDEEEEEEGDVDDVVQEEEPATAEEAKEAGWILPTEAEEQKPSEDKGKEKGLFAEESSDSSGAGPSTEAKGTFAVTVGDYQKHGEGLKAYVSYNINVKTSLAQYAKQEFVAQRRFSDFVWLHDKLRESFKGFIIPPLPSKTITQNRFDTQFIERRRRELEKFLKEITEHPVIANSEVLQTFLETAPENFDAEKLKKPQSGYTKKMFSWVSSTVTQQLNPAMEVDPWFETKEAYLQELEGQISSLLKLSSSLLEKDKERIVLQYEIGAAAGLVSKAEQEVDPSLATKWAKLGDVYEQIRLIEQESSNDHEIRFDEPLGNYLRLIQAAKETLNNRKMALAEYQNAEKRLANLKEKMEKPGYKPSKTNDTNLEQFTKRLEETKEEYEMITESVRKEMTRFEAVKGKELKKAILEWAKSNMDATVQIADQWKKLINHIQSE